MSYQEIIHERYKVIFEEPEIYVDNEARGRSGHMTHAMVQFAPDTYINFNANCSATRAGGHSVYGWVMQVKHTLTRRFFLIPGKVF